MAQEIDVERVRRETPGCERGAHFLHSGASLMPSCVVDAMHRHLDLEAAIGGYAAARESTSLLDDSYRQVARLLNASPTEIAVVENATVAWNQVFYGIAATMGPGDRVLTSSAEYASNYLAFLQARKRLGIEIEVIPDDATGGLDVVALRERIDDRVKLIAITHVPTGNGLINPAAAIGRVAKSANVPYLLDACQSVGQLAIDVEEIGCDFLSATARKFLRGPRGVGFLYVRDGSDVGFEPGMIDLHGATWIARDDYELVGNATRYENWEDNVAGKIGLGVAARYAIEVGIDAIEARVRRLAEQLRGRLRRIDGISVTDVGRERCGIVSFRHDRISSESVRDQLRARRFEVGTSTVASTRIQMEKLHLDVVVRAAVHYFNRDEEVTQLGDAVAEIVRSES